MGLVDGPKAPVCVVVGAGAGAERPHCGVGIAQLKSWQGRGCPLAAHGVLGPTPGSLPPTLLPSSLTSPERRRLPMLVVVGEAREAGHAACVVVLQALKQLAELLLALLLPQQPHLVLFLQPLPTGTQAISLTPYSPTPGAF